MKRITKYIGILKLFILLGLLFSAYQSSAQFDCTIFCRFEGDTSDFSKDTIACYKQRAYLYTQFADSLNYIWEPGGMTGVIVTVELKDPVMYILTVYTDDSSFMCKDSIYFDLYPKIEVSFEQINKGCPDECKAQVKATASGGHPPYRYLWSAVVAPNDSSLALGLCTDEEAQLLVKDTICAFDTAFLVEGYDMPEIDITVEPDSLLFETNPKAKFSFDNKSADSISLTNWVWLFPDSSSTNLLMPEYAFVDSINTVKFIYTTIDGCIDTIEQTILVKPFELTVYNVFTPNGDGINDLWEIPDLDKYISNELIIFNRWGERVFEEKNYRNDWDGGNLPDGVYFYILRCNGYWKEEIFKGSVSIYGGGH